MRHRFEYTAVTSWPSLAWLCRCRFGSEVNEVFHGPGVETTPEWFCEAVWAGEFERGGFDQTDIIAGSGGRARERGVVFVSSGSTVDRLQRLETSEGVMLSNSLCCLLAMAGGSLDSAYPHFHAVFHSVNHGISRYTRQIDSSVGPVEFTYFHNLVWTGQVIIAESKGLTAPEFTRFEDYRDFLKSSMQSFAKNARAAERRQPFQPVCALSSGYDSPTVGVLARNSGGCLEAVSFDVDRDGCDDSGETIAKYLNMNCTMFPREGWRSGDRPEIPFIAGSPGASDVLWAGVGSKLAGTVLFTGFYGDAVWAKDSNYDVSDLARGDGSGRSLTEYRLRANFIHCPVPFWGARSGQQLTAISQSQAMQPWDVTGKYSRPICRRMVEEAGVPREMFGQGKRGVSVQLYRPNAFLTPAGYEDYLIWLQEHRRAWINNTRIPPTPFIANGLHAALSLLETSMNELKNRLPAHYGLHRVQSLLKRSASKLHSMQHGVGTSSMFDLRRYTFPWAVERGKDLYPPP